MEHDYTCSMCGHTFSANEAMHGCARCSLASGGCHMIRCPSCGYEMPPPPRLPRLLSGLAARLRGKKRSVNTTH